MLPNGMEGELGVTAIDCNVAEETVTVLWPVALPAIAVIVVLLPSVAPVTRPVAFTVAAAGTDELHCAALVQSCDEPSERVACALNCVAEMVLMVTLDGLTVSAVTDGTGVFSPLAGV